jgi:hypothetical protein
LTLARRQARSSKSSGDPLLVAGRRALSQERTGVYRIREFAALAGVTVRALHHSDRLGLLQPSGRSGGGYRLYRVWDLARSSRWSC